MAELLPFKAFIFGIISAASLPLGALVAMFWVPKPRVVAAFMAFGGGALLSALTIDLVAETLRKGDFYPLALGCIIGGILFDVLNEIVNRQGGFLRKAATTISFLKKKKVQQFKIVFNKMSHVHLFHNLPPQEVQALIPYVTSRTFTKGAVLMRQGEPGDSLFIIESGEVDIIDEQNNSKKIATLRENDIVGEMALLTGESRTATAVAVKETRVWIVLKEYFDKVLRLSPILAEAVKLLVGNRLSELQEQKAIDSKHAQAWVDKAIKYIDDKVAIPTDTEIKEAASSHGGAPLSIWLGILLDGIPESIVIGSSMIHTSISFSLIAGLFLSNFPEALSSSVGMRQQGYSFKKIIGMWTALMIITGIGAYFGNIFFVEAPNFLFALVDGMAAGAMLTMIAETMLPESYYKGGQITGFCTLLGFLAAIFFKTLE